MRWSPYRDSAARTMLALLLMLAASACQGRRQDGASASKPAARRGGAVGGAVRAANEADQEAASPGAHDRVLRPPAVTVAERLRALHEAASETDGDVLGVTKDAEVYRVTLAGGGSPRSIDTAIVSRHGDLLMESAFNLPRALRGIAVDKHFAECLKAESVQIFVARRDAKSRAMYQEIGRFAHLVAVDCGAQGKSMCEQLGVQVTPAVSVRGVLAAGAKSRAWFESATGCKAAR